MKKLILIFIVVAFVFLFYLVWRGFSFINSTPGKDNTVVIITIKPSMSVYTIAHQLKDDGIITDEEAFRLLVRLTGETRKIKAGEYALRRNMYPNEILQTLVGGKSIEYSFTVAEGLNIFEIARLYEQKGFGSAKDFLNACKNRELISTLLDEKLDSLEGYLSPETYRISKTTSMTSLIKMLVHRFIDIYENEIASDAIRIGMTRAQVVTLASIIEKETGVDSERTLVSSVFHNRLRDGVYLQTDPTVLYGIWVGGDTSRMNITKEDLKVPNQYNTYTFKGLPKGPIANPGKQSLIAAVRPQQTNFLFFVSRNDGTHTFSKTLAEHNRAVENFQKRREAREGKSWRNLHKKKASGH
jgi:UPF0755 protein